VSQAGPRSGLRWVGPRAHKVRSVGPRAHRTGRSAGAAETDWFLQHAPWRLLLISTPKHQDRREGCGYRARRPSPPRQPPRGIRPVCPLSSAYQVHADSKPYVGPSLIMGQRGSYTIPMTHDHGRRT
jgi:hypothetical protein